MQTSTWTLLHNAWLIFQKDLRLEFRTRYALNAILMFAVTTMAAISFAIGPNRLEPYILAPLLWIVLFFSAMSGLAHVFVREEEQQTADTLRLTVPANAVFLGKWLFNIILLLGMQIIIIPLFFVMMTVESGVNFDIFYSVIILGSLGLSSAATIIAAIIALSGSRGALFAVLSFPIMLPILISAINGTRLALEGEPFVDASNDLTVLISFTVVIFTAGLMVFEFVWRK